MYPLLSLWLYYFNNPYTAKSLEFRLSSIADDSEDFHSKHGLKKFKGQRQIAIGGHKSVNR